MKTSKVFDITQIDFRNRIVKYSIKVIIIGTIILNKIYFVKR